MATPNLPEYNVPGFKIPDASVPQPNQNLKDIIGRQLDISKQYEQNIPGMVNGQASTYNRQARSGLTQGIRQTRENFNQRGLLRSGQRQGAEYGLKDQAETDMANNRFNLNQNAVNNKNQLQQNAVNSGLLYAGAAPQLGASALSGANNTLQNDISNMQNAGNIAGGLGSGLGSLAGAIYSKSQQSSNINPYGYGVPGSAGYGSAGAATASNIGGYKFPWQ